MKITRLDTFILHVPVTNQRVADSHHQVSEWGAVGVVVHTDTEHRGFGYTGTLGHVAADRLIRRCIADAYGELLLGEDPLETQHLWSKLYHAPGIRWVGRAGITQMALSAIDIALWDIKAKAAQQPLWKLLGGNDGKRIEAYNSDGGWLNLSKQQLVDAAHATAAQGFRGLKLKIGSPHPADDVERVGAVRAGVDRQMKVMVDADGCWDLPTARQMGRQLQDLDVHWFEEPTAFDDVASHARLVRELRMPIALGGRLYSPDAFGAFVDAGALHFVQADATRLGGITPWLQAADRAAAAQLPVCPHVGDMMQVHLHLAMAHPACAMLEYIPWLRGCFEEPATVESGFFKVPQAPGAGTTIRAERIARFGID